MALVGYARVSTRDQHPEAQVDQLTAAGCERVFVDKASGKLASRPQLDRCLDHLRAGDVLVITKLDRLGRSVKNLVELALTLGESGVDLRVLSQGIDTSTPGGRLTFHILGAIAEFERDLISERTLDGLEAARARGRVGGRKPKLNARQVAMVKQMAASGEHSISAIADTFSVSRPTIYAVLNTKEVTATV